MASAFLKFKLHLSAVFFALVLYAFLDLEFIDSGGGQEIPVRPKTNMTIIQLIQKREFAPHDFGSVGF